MKHHLLLLTLLLVTHIGLGQFHRSFSNTIPDMNGLKTKIVESDDDTIRLANIQYTSASNPTLKISTISPSGDLLTVQHFDCNLPSGIGNELYLSAVFKKQNFYLFCLMAYSNTVQHVSIIEVNATTGQIFQQFNHPTDFKTGYSEAIFLNNEIVHYLVKSSGGLFRIANSVNTLASVTEESVDNSVTNAAGYSSLSLLRKSFHTIVCDNKEITAPYALNSNLTFYSRDLPSSYSNHPVGGTILGAVGLIAESDTSFMITDASDYYRIRSDLSIESSGTYSNFTNVTNFHLLKDQAGNYFRIIRTPGSPVYLEQYDVQMQLLAQKNAYMNNIGPGKKIGAFIVFYGVSDRQTVDLDQNGTPTYTPPVSLLAMKDSLFSQPIQEYNYVIEQDDLQFNAGMSDKVFNYFHSTIKVATYQNHQSLMATMNQIHEGKLTNGDTVGKPNDPFTSQSRVGPYTTPALYNDIVEAQFNRGFYVTREMITAHIDSIQANSSTYKAPFGILFWPGNGNTALGQAAQLAGFIDLNQNGIYEPSNGEYPQIYGDRCFLQISHDHPNLSNPGGVENHTYLYSFECDSADYLTNTLFIKTVYFLRTQAINGFNTGIYVDMDNGYPQDDYAGTHVELGMLYNYNGDLNDENWSGEFGFGDTLAAEGLMILKGNKKDDDGADNPDNASATGCTNGIGFGDGIADNEYLTLERSFYYSSTGQIADPQNVNQWFNIAQGFWSDGSPLFYGATGNFNYGTTTMIKSKYVFPGGSDTLFYGTDGVDPGFEWNESAPSGPGSSSNPVQDRRMYGYQGSSNLNQGDSVMIDMAFLFVNRTASGTDSITSILPDLFEKGAKIKAAFNQNSTACGSDFNPIQNDLGIHEIVAFAPVLYPNPTSGTFRISGLNGQTAQLTLFNMDGKILLQRSVSEQDIIQMEHCTGNVFYARISTDAGTQTFKLIKL